MLFLNSCVTLRSLSWRLGKTRVLRKKREFMKQITQRFPPLQLLLAVMIPTKLTINNAAFEVVDFF